MELKKPDTEGLFGIMMTSDQAFELEEIVKDLPKEDPYVHVRTKAFQPEPIEVDKEERSDVSWISTEDKDHQKDIVLAKGFKLDLYRKNPIVTWNHDYKQPAIGRNVWVKRKAAAGDRAAGLIAKTHYPVQPDDWHTSTPWMPSQILNLVHLRLLPGKSVGFLPLKARPATGEEIKKDAKTYGDVRYIVEEALLLEYSVETMPCNYNSLVEASHKGLVTKDYFELLGVELPKEEEPPPAVQTKELPPLGPFLTKAQYEKAIQDEIASLDYEKIAKKLAKDELDVYLGRP